jgi:hypothetical protein
MAEYENVLGRADLFAGSILSSKECSEVFDGLLNRCRWIEVFYAWRPNLPDEADNHLIELAVAGFRALPATRRACTSQSPIAPAWHTSSHMPKTEAALYGPM